MSARPVTAWNIIPGESPPQPGGVSDYTRLVAHGLAEAGDEVCVYAPPTDAPELSLPANLRVNRLPDHFARRGLKELAQASDRNRTAQALGEKGPHAFGMKAMNVPLCLMLLRRRSSKITVMFHEVAYPI